MTTSEYIPVSNEDLFLVYFQPVNGLVKSTIRSKIPNADADMIEEMASAVMFRFIESDLLNRFDPKRVSSFRSFLYNIVVNEAMDYYRKNKGSESLGEVDNDDENNERDMSYVASVEATQQVTQEWGERIESMEAFVSRCARLNRHKRDRSLKSVLAMTADGDTLETMSASLGVSIATVRNYIRYVAHGALAETNGTAAQYAAESTYRPDARREMSAKDILELVRANKDKTFAYVDNDGKRYFPQFVSYRRGWHFVTFGAVADVSLSAYTGDSRGFKLFKQDGETVIKVRAIEYDGNVVLLKESA